MFNKAELEELQNIISWAICEGYISDKINPNLKNIISKLNFCKEDLREIEDISGKKIL